VFVLATASPTVVTAGAAQTVTLTCQAAWVRVVNMDASATIWVRNDGTNASAATGSYGVPAGKWIEVRPADVTAPAVSVFSAGSPVVVVERADVVRREGWDD